MNPQKDLNVNDSLPGGNDITSHTEADGIVLSIPDTQFPNTQMTPRNLNLPRSQLTPATQLTPLTQNTPKTQHTPSSLFKPKSRMNSNYDEDPNGCDLSFGKYPKNFNPLEPAVSNQIQTSCKLIELKLR